MVQSSTQLGVSWKKGTPGGEGSRVGRVGRSQEGRMCLTCPLSTAAGYAASPRSLVRTCLSQTVSIAHAWVGGGRKDGVSVPIWHGFYIITVCGGLRNGPPIRSSNGNACHLTTHLTHTTSPPLSPPTLTETSLATVYKGTRSRFGHLRRAGCN
jgi:hypothetical protein